jgi:hypothetical protein
MGTYIRSAIKNFFEMCIDKKRTQSKSHSSPTPSQLLPWGRTQRSELFHPDRKLSFNLPCQCLQELLRFGVDLFRDVRSSPPQLNFHVTEEEVTGGQISQKVS